MAPRARAESPSTALFSMRVHRLMHARGTHRVFFDMSIGGKPAGRVTFELVRLARALRRRALSHRCQISFFLLFSLFSFVFLFASLFAANLCDSLRTLCRRRRRTFARCAPARRARARAASRCTTRCAPLAARHNVARRSPNFEIFCFSFAGGVFCLFAACDAGLQSTSTARECRAPSSTA